MPEQQSRCPCCADIALPPGAVCLQCGASGARMTQEQRAEEREKAAERRTPPEERRLSPEELMSLLARAIIIILPPPLPVYREPLRIGRIGGALLAFLSRKRALRERAAVPLTRHNVPEPS